MWVFGLAKECVASREQLRPNGEQVLCDECKSTNPSRSEKFFCRESLLCGKLCSQNGWNKISGFGPGLEKNGHGDQCAKYKFQIETQTHKKTGR